MPRQQCSKLGRSNAHRLSYLICVLKKYIQSITKELVYLDLPDCLN